MLIHSYALWNNKGGVGKSTITYHLACRYAENNPDKKVLVIDLCPQGNSSMMLLGGGDVGETKVLDFCSTAVPKTVVGYLSTVITNGMGGTLPNPYDFLVNVNNENRNLPDNLYLLCGDGNLEPMAPAINSNASQPPLTPTAQPWKWIQLIFKNFIDNLTSATDEWMVFVDTNPSFSIYTQMAVSSVERLITPINADDSSRTAAKAMAILLHGTNPAHPIYGNWTYASQAKNHGIIMPQIHIIVGNRLTQFEGAAAAFNAITDATAESLFDIYRSNPQYFTTRSNAISNLIDFKNNYSLPLRDFNSAGVVCAHLGRKLSSMAQGYYPVYGSRAKVNSDKIEECKKAIDAIVSYIS